MMYVQKASHGEHGRVVYPVRSAGILRSLTGGYVFYESGTHLMNEYEVQDDHVTNSIEIER